MQSALLDQAFGYPTFVDILQFRALSRTDDVAIRFLVDGEDEEETVTFGELDRRARAIAAWLLERGLSGQRALLLYPAGIDFVAAFYGCLYAGVIAVPAYPPRLNRSLERIEAIHHDCEAAAALTVQAVVDRVQSTLAETPELKQIPWLATDTLEPGIESTWKRPDIGRQTLAFLQYTSGSTGLPKGVMINHGNLLANCELITIGFELGRRSCGCFWLPSYHDMGLVGGLLEPMYTGCGSIIMSPVSFLQRPFRWLRAISKYRATVAGGPNFAFDLCVRKTTPEQRAQLDLSCWTVAFNGAEPVRAETLDRFAEMFEPHGFRRDAFYPCYGLAEATLIVSGGIKAEPPIVRAYDSKALENGDVVPVLPGHEQGSRRLVSSGHILPTERVLIVDPETKQVAAPGEVGEIWVQSASVAQGYWKRAEETEHTFHALLADTGEGPFMRTGDLGFFDGPELFIAGRLKDLIIIRGLNHYPHDIELTAERASSALRPGCGAAFTVDIDDEPRLVLVYEVDRHQVSESRAIVEAIRSAVSRDHELIVDAIRLVRQGTIPKTSSGKIQRHACRRAFINDALEVVASWDYSPDEETVVSAAPTPEPTAPQPVPPHREFKLSAIAEPEREASHAEADDNAPVNLVEEVLHEVRRVAKERARGLTLETNITEIGLDSLERMEILAALEERFGGRFPEEVLASLETCREVVEGVEKYLGKNGKLVRNAGPDIPEEHYQFSAWPEYLRLRQNIEMAESSFGNPYFAVHQRVTNDTTMIDGRELINFSSYNYVGMSGDPQVARAAKEAIDRYGTSVSASRLVSGEKVIHRELECAIADFLGVDDSILYVGGHSTNETTIGHLLGPGDLILHDALSHNSIIQGCKLSGARRRPFAHNDWQEVDTLLHELRREYRRVLVVIEGVYSMDGDIPDLPRFIEVKRRHKALLMVDEAHSIGTLGAHGRGISEYYGVNPRDVDIWMGTLSKSFGSCGGYIAGDKALIEYLKYTSPGFVYSVGMPPSGTAAALASLSVLRAHPERVQKLRDNAQLFLTLAQQRGLNTGLSKDSPVVPVITGNSLHALMLSYALKERGINVQPILYPAVEERAARLRFFITSCHTPEQIRFTVDCVAEELAKIQPEGSVPSAS